MVSPGAPGGVRDPCPITWVPINIHSAATRPVRIRAGFFIVSSSTGILEALEGLGKGKKEGSAPPLFQISVLIISLLHNRPLLSQDGVSLTLAKRVLGSVAIM
jgi:hypothetical protein